MNIDFLIIFLIIFSYAAMQFIESFSFCSRIAGRIASRLATGITLQNSFYVFSRIFLPLILVLMAFIIEQKISLKEYLMIAASMTFFALISNFLSLLKTNQFQIFFQKIFHNLDKNILPIAIIKTIVNPKDIKEFTDLPFKVGLKNYPPIALKTFISAFAFLFLGTGFLISFTFAILYPEYRMTMSQFATVFHGIGNIVLVFLIDPMLGKSLDNYDSEIYRRNYFSVIYGRVLASFFACCIFSYFAFFYSFG